MKKFIAGFDDYKHLATQCIAFRTFSNYFSNPKWEEELPAMINWIKDVDLTIRGQKPQPRDYHDWEESVLVEMGYPHI